MENSHESGETHISTYGDRALAQLLSDYLDKMKKSG